MDVTSHVIIIMKPLLIVLSNKTIFLNFITAMIVPIGNGRCWFGTFTVLIASVRALFETGVLLGLNLQQ